MSDLFEVGHKHTRKNFSRNNTGKRRAGDFYQTPPSMTRQFLAELPPMDFPVLEPACGAGAIAKEIANAYGQGSVVAYDISEGIDFLNETRRFPEIITNPPFSLSLEFILKCKEVATKRFSLLMPIDYLHGQERFNKVYTAKDSWGLSWVHVYVRRAMMTDKYRDDGKYETGMITWAWFTWVHFGNNEPRINWIDNNDYVARAAQ